MTQSLRINEHLLIAACSEQHDQAARAMLDHFALLDAAGPQLAPGSRIDFGWAPLQIEARGKDWFVCEPDFDSEPMRWRPSVDATLGVLQSQAALVRQSGVAPLATRGDQTLWLTPDALDAARVYLHRTEPDSPAECGWYVGCAQDDRDDAEPRHAVRVRAGRLLTLKPEWLPALILPTGYLVNFEQGRLAEIYDDQDKCIYPAETEPDG